MSINVFKRFILIAFLMIFGTCVSFGESASLHPDREGVISKSSRGIDSIYPDNFANFNSNMFFPGNRGTNQLVIYRKDFGRTTGTNEYGREAIVKGDMVIALSGANSIIPSDGYVISGHGTAKKWISDNIKIGTKIKIDEISKTITAYTTVESYHYQAGEKIEEVEKLIKITDFGDNKELQKQIKKHLKRARYCYRKSNGKDQEDLDFAREAIQEAGIALNISLVYLPNELKGVWIRPVETSRGEIERTLNSMKDIGIEDVFLETFFHGKTIYPSDVMKGYGFYSQNSTFQNIDPLAVWTQEAHKRNMRIHVWFQSFYIGNKVPSSEPQSILALRPDWGNRNKANYTSSLPVAHPSEHNGYFLDPANPQVTQFLYDLIYEICAKYSIDGINLDYLRYPSSAKPDLASYENTNWGYTPYARDEFKMRYGTDPVDFHTNSPLWAQWSLYRQEKITNFVRSISDLLKSREIVLSAVVFPTEENCLEVKQQNWQRWTESNMVNAITPLILTADYDLTNEMLKNLKRKTSRNIKIYPGIFVPFMNVEPEDLLKQYHAIRKERLDGIILFDWAHLDSKYTSLLKSSAFKKE